MTPNHGLPRRVQEFGAYLMTAKDLANMNPRCPDTWVLGPVSAIVIAFVISCGQPKLDWKAWHVDLKKHSGVIGGLWRIERSKSSRIDNHVLFASLEIFLLGSTSEFKKTGSRAPTPHLGLHIGALLQDILPPGPPWPRQCWCLELLHVLEPASAQLFPPVATRSATPKSLEPSKGISTQLIVHCD